MLLTLNISEKNIKKFSISIYYTVVVAKAKDHARSTFRIHPDSGLTLLISLRSVRRN